jgi:uncharacterized ubiquitin-like protein YukD
MKKLIAVLMVVGLMVGCAGMKTQAPVTVCQEFPGDSLIEKYVPDLRTASTLIKLSVYEVSKLKQVQKEDIVKVLYEAQALSEKSTYNDFAIYLMSKVKWIQNNMGPEIAIIGNDLLSFENVTTPISPKDQCYIKYQIADIRNKVLPWIPAKK